MKTAGIIAGLVVLVLLLGFTLVACDDQPAASSGVELDIDGHKKAKPKTSTPRKPATTRKARR